MKQEAQSQGRIKPFNGEVGTALVETILMIGVLVIFIIGIPMLGTMVDLKQKTIEASRYAAWEKTIHTNSNPVVDQVDARFFMHESSPIQSLSLSKDQLGPNSLWGELHKQNNYNDHAQKRSDAKHRATANLPLFQRARISAEVGNIRTHVGEDVSSWGAGYVTQNNSGFTPLDNQQGNPTPPPHRGLIYSNIGAAITEMGSFISKNGWESENPFSNGLMRSEIEVEMKNNEIMTFAGTNCSQGGAGCFQESTAILIDGWSAANPKDIRDRVHGFVPSARLERVGDFVSKVSIVPMMADLENLKGSFGCVKLGVLPAKQIGELPRYDEMPGDDC